MYSCSNPPTLFRTYVQLAAGFGLAWVSSSASTVSSQRCPSSFWRTRSRRCRRRRCGSEGSGARWGRAVGAFCQRSTRQESGADGAAGTCSIVELGGSGRRRGAGHASNLPFPQSRHGGNPGLSDMMPLIDCTRPPAASPSQPPPQLADPEEVARARARAEALRERFTKLPAKSGRHKHSKANKASESWELACVGAAT